jgi:hypothetical protein
MFAKGPDGTLDKDAAAALAAVQAVPSVSSATEQAKVQISNGWFRANDADRAKFDAAAKSAGYASFGTFITDESVAAEKVEEVRKALESAGISLDE